jgi:hypothetical protein
MLFYFSRRFLAEGRAITGAEWLILFVRGIVAVLVGVLAVAAGFASGSLAVWLIVIAGFFGASEAFVRRRLLPKLVQKREERGQE